MYPQSKNDYFLVVSHTCRTHVDVDANGPTAVGANLGCPSGHCVVGGRRDRGGVHSGV